MTISEDGDEIGITAENVPVPETTTPSTGDTGRDPLGYVMLIAGILGIILSLCKYRKIANEGSDPVEEYAELCPDFIEGDGNE